jgi:hypothetical protein
LADGEADVATLKLSIPYGDGDLPFELPETNLLEVVRPGCDLGEEQAPPAAPTDADEQAEIRRALAEPIGAPPLADPARRRRHERRLQRLPGPARRVHAAGRRRAAALRCTSSPSNFKRWRLDVFYGVSAAHLQSCLDEFCYRLWPP